MTEFVHELETAIVPKGHADMEPVPVRVVGDSSERIEVAELNAFQNIQFAGTEPAQRLVGHSKLRKKVQVFIRPGAAGNAVGAVFFGSQEQVQAGRGGRFVSGDNFVIESQREIWFAPDGTNSLTVTWIDERYDRG